MRNSQTECGLCPCYHDMVYVSTTLKHVRFYFATKLLNYNFTAYILQANVHMGHVAFDAKRFGAALYDVVLFGADLSGDALYGAK